MSDKQVRAQYTREYKLESVLQVRGGQSIAATAKVLGVPKASLSNWARQSAQGVDVGGAADKAAGVTAEQMELARLRAEVARLRMERDIAKKAAAPFRRTRCEVRLDLPNGKAIPCEHFLRSAGGQRQWVLHLAAPPHPPPGQYSIDANTMG